MIKLGDENGYSTVILPEHESTNELITKDGTGTKAPQYIAGLTASLAALSMGTTLAWTSQISPELQNGVLGFPLTSDQLGWVGSIMSLGAATLSLFTGVLSNFMGIKLTMLVLIIPATLGWSLIIWAQNIAMLYCGRFITGMVAGAFCVLAAIYTSEIAQKEIRGALGSYTQLMISFGILFANTVAIFLSVKYYTMTCAAVPIVFGAIFIFMPETPIYLVKKNKVAEARRVLVRLRGVNYDVDKEIKEIESSLKDNQLQSGFEVIKESLKKSSSKKACVIGFGLMIFKSANGMDAITTYTSYIFEDMKFNAKIGTIILNVVQATTAVFQSLVVDRTGRRVLLWLSGSIMSVCLTIVGVSVMLKDRKLISEEYFVYVEYLPLAALILFTIAFSLGLGPIPWLMLGEIFPPEIKNAAAAAATFVSWIATFTVTKLFIVVETNWALDIAFFIFAVATALAVIFTLVLIPETKNKTFEEIQHALE